MGKKKGLKAPILGKKEVLRVLGDMDSMPWGETTAYRDSTIPWPLSKLRTWIETEQSKADCPGELLDLEMAEFSMVMAELEIKEIENGKKGIRGKRGDKGDPELAVLSGIEIGRYLARYEMRSQRKVFSRGEKSLTGSSEGGKKGAATTNEAYKKLRPKYQPEVDFLVAQGNSYSIATEKVATLLGVSGSTVRNHTENHSPRNRGRRKG